MVGTIHDGIILRKSPPSQSPWALLTKLYVMAAILLSIVLPSIVLSRRNDKNHHNSVTSSSITSGSSSSSSSSTFVNGNDRPDNTNNYNNNNDHDSHSSYNSEDVVNRATDGGNSNLPTTISAPHPPPPRPASALDESPSRSPSTPRPNFTRAGFFQIMESVPSDPNAFTQGLLIVQEEPSGNIVLYTGTGLYGQSELRKVDLPTGTVLQRHALSNAYFGEGIAYYTVPTPDDSGNTGRIVQLTWQSQIGFVYDSETLELLSNFTFTTTKNEGWGITVRKPLNSQHSDADSYFIVSDGSSYLHYWNITTFQEIRRIRVIARPNEFATNNISISNLNELEYDPYTDTVLANVWFSDIIYRIDVNTGLAITSYNLAGLYPLQERTGGYDAVMNGIALVPGQPDQVWVTGKLWPRMYRIRLIDSS